MIISQQASNQPMPSPPELDFSRLEPHLSNSIMEPDFLGFTARSWVKLMAEQGPVFKATVAGKQHYVICGHDVDVAAWKQPSNWIYGPPAPGGNFFREQLGNTHVTQLDGEAHRRARKLILPAFGVASVTRDLDIAAEVIGSSLAALPGAQFNLHTELSVMMAKSLSKTQVKTSLTEDELRLLVTFEEMFIPAVALSPENRLSWYSTDTFQRARAFSFNRFEAIVTHRLVGDRPGDSLDFIMDQAAPNGWASLSKDELVSATYLLLVAGVGNIANILCAAVWALAEHPVWMDRLRAELETFSPPVLKSGLRNLPVLKAVISEVERCYLPAPVIPKMTAGAVDLFGMTIPAGVSVLHLHGLAHFEPERYDRPEEFDPSRWLDNRAARANAFGGGIHLCLGMGVTRLYVPMVLALLTQQYDCLAQGAPTLVSQNSEIDYAPKTTELLMSIQPRVNSCG